MSQKFIAFLEHQDAHDTVNQVIKDYWGSGVVVPGGIDAALSAKFDNSLPQSIIVDVSKSIQPERDAKNIVSHFHNIDIIIIVGLQNDVRAYRSMIQAGAKDYLPIPFSAGDLYRVLSESLVQQEENVPIGGSSKLVTIMGANGGVGTSMLATNLSWILAEEFNKKVALIDLDVHFGTIALALDLEPSVGFRDALESPGRVDSMFVDNILVPATNNLNVLAAEESIDDYVTYNNTSIELLLEVLQTKHDYVLVDTPRSILRRCPPLIADAEIVVLVATLTVPSLRDTVTILSEIRKISPTKEVSVVINRRREKGRGEVNLQDFEKEVEKKVAMVIPDAPDIVTSALNSGRPIVEINNNSNISESLRAFCQYIDDGSIKQSSTSQKSILSKLFKS